MWKRNRLVVWLAGQPGPFFTVTIRWVARNTPPVAEARPDQTIQVGATVYLDGTGSRDADGDSLTYAWTLQRPKDSGAALSDPSAVKPRFTVDRSGSYTARLVVNGGRVNSAPDTVTVTTDNSPPVAAAGPDQTAPAGQSVTLDGSGSYDADGDALTYCSSSPRVARRR